MSEPDRADHFTPRSYRVRHVTSYEYDLPRVAAYELGYLTPRETPWQTVESTLTRIEPEPAILRSHPDGYGNLGSYFEVRGEHMSLRIEQESLVHVRRPHPDMAGLRAWTVGEAAAGFARSGDAEAVEFLLPSPLVELSDALRAYAASYLTPDAPLGDAALALTRGIYRDFEYRSGVTTVHTTLGELLERRQGVCQDFAQLAIGCLRSAGIPARYVSGYLETSPPPGGQKLEGSDASHAWASLMLPSGEWLELDPTNDHFADGRYVVTAWGRDFSDVSPLRGIVYGEATSSRLRVGVDVVRL